MTKFKSKKIPFIYSGVVGTVQVKLAEYEYDSLQFINDSAGTIRFSVDGGNTFFSVYTFEAITWDNFGESNSLFIYAAAASSAFRVVLWKSIRE